MNVKQLMSTDVVTIDEQASCREAEVFQQIGNVPVEQVMSSPVVCVGPEASLEVAAGRMREGELGSLPVVEGGRIVGILTETDLLRRIVGTDTGVDEVDAIVVSYP